MGQIPKRKKNASKNLKGSTAAQKWREKFEGVKKESSEKTNEIQNLRSLLHDQSEEFQHEKELRKEMEDQANISEGKVKLMMKEMEKLRMKNEEISSKLVHFSQKESSLCAELQLVKAEMDAKNTQNYLTSVKSMETTSVDRKIMKDLIKNNENMQKEISLEKEVSSKLVDPLGHYSCNQSVYKKNQAVKKLSDFIRTGIKTTADYNDLIRNILKRPPFLDAQPLVLTPIETFTIRSIVHLSDGDLRKMKQMLKKHLGVDIFSSRNSVVEMKKQLDNSDNYIIDIVKTMKTAPNGQKEMIDTARYKIKDLSKGITDRIQRLENSGLLDCPDDLTLCLVGDRGSEETKICVSIENVSHPNSPHNLLLVALYEGPDTQEEMRSNALEVFQMWNELKEVTFMSRDGRIFIKKIKKKLIGDMKYLSALFGHQGQSVICSCYVCNMEWSYTGKKMLQLKDVNDKLIPKCRTLQSYIEDSKKGQNGVVKDSIQLCTVEPVDIVLPTFHIVQGVYEKYFQSHINGQLNMMDNKSKDSASTLKQQKKEHSNLVKKENEAKKHQDTVTRAQ